jgi:hypothetical protein
VRHLIDRFGELWCIHTHASVMWPFRGRYRCSVCLREYRVRFEDPNDPDTAAETRAAAFTDAVAMGKA